MLVPSSDSRHRFDLLTKERRRLQERKLESCIFRPLSSLLSPVGKGHRSATEVSPLLQRDSSHVLRLVYMGNDGIIHTVPVF